jgi:DNA-nicking Smr family endonuclease
MKSKKSPYTLRSFQELKGVLDLKSLPDNQSASGKECGKKKSSESEKELLERAMEGVTPLSREKYAERIFIVEPAEGFKKKDDAETLKRLEDLVHYGKGFNVCDTPEYIEGTGYHVHRQMAKRLHQGDFSIQAHLDLHGLITEEAKEIFDQFMKWAATNGKTGLLVTHGRGLSSPAEPVLKKKVEEWLTRGVWRKWVVAYSSARKCDGGAGATYLLLRPRPMSKRLKKRQSLNKIT